MNRRKWTDEQFIQAVKNNKSYTGVIRKIGLIPAGSNFDTVKRKIAELNLDTSHFTGQGWNTGDRYRQIRPKVHIDKILVEHSSYTNTDCLRRRLLSEGLKERKCECYERTEWMGEPIPLELHHINGVKDDLRIENLQTLCPNCHAFTDNYRGKGMSACIEKCKVEAG